MTMNEYTKSIMENIPAPATVRQSLVQQFVTMAINDLTTKGEAHLFGGRYGIDGNRNVLCATARKVQAMFEAKGYIVSLYEYSTNNRDSYFSMTIRPE